MTHILNLFQLLCKCKVINVLRILGADTSHNCEVALLHPESNRSAVYRIAAYVPDRPLLPLQYYTGISALHVLVLIHRADV